MIGDGDILTCCHLCIWIENKNNVL